MIKLTNVTKVYGEDTGAVVALNDVSLEIPDGKFVGIVGPSGCGKSTLLNLIGALDTPTSGSIEIDGAELTSMTADQAADFRNRTLGYIFQSFFLEPIFTVLENVEMPLMIAGEKKSVRREKALRVIAKLGLADKADKKVSTLSGGQKQRVSIARALTHEPKLILADEPTGNLDSKNGAEVMAILRGLCEEGRTVVLVTHNPLEAAKVDYLIELKDGQVVGTQEQIAEAAEQ